MRNGIEKIKEIWEFITYRTGEEESTEEFRRKITWLSLGIFCFFIFMMVFYCLGGRTTKMYGTISMAVSVGIICLTCMYALSERTVRFAAGGVVIFEATLLITLGAGRGFGVYWILAIPVVYILFFGLLDTLIVGGYFWVLFTLTYLIPVRKCIPYYYFWGIRFYFPYLYTLVFFVIIALGVREKKMMITMQKRKIFESHGTKRVVEYMALIAADMPEVIATIPELTHISNAIEEMYSGRCGHKAYSKEEIMENLEVGAGIDYDRRMAAIAWNLVAEGMLESVDERLDDTRIE